MNHKSTIKCIGIIMDGNRRWAKAKGLSSFEGHELGYRKIGEVLGWAREAGIKNLVIYCFSTENWNRAKEEIEYLLGLFKVLLSEEVALLKTKKVRVKFVGDLERFNQELQALMKKAESETSGFYDQNLVLALSYGGRSEIMRAVRNLFANRTAQEIARLTEDEFAEFLGTAGIPDPDLIIRTGGEMRLSNFLPWQAVYSELFFPKTYWPEFSKEEFFAILDEFQKRQRRFGK